MTSGESITGLQSMIDVLWQLPNAEVLSCDLYEGQAKVHLYVHDLEEFVRMTGVEEPSIDTHDYDVNGSLRRFVFARVGGVLFQGILNAAPGAGTPETAKGETNHSISIADADAEVKEDSNEIAV